MRLNAEIKGQVAFYRKLSRLVGWKNALRIRGMQIAIRMGLPVGASLRLRSPHLLHPIVLRINSTDADVFGQVLVDQQYARLADLTANVIVDCGANAGYTSAYLLSLFPNAQLFAIEPFVGSAALCRRNLAPYGERAKVIEAAIWSHCTWLAMDHTDGDEWAVRVRAAEPGETSVIRAIDLPSLGLDRIDILKIDIEGSEAELSTDGVERWLPSVSNIAIELHGAVCEQRFREAMAAYCCTISHSGELTVCRDISRVR